MDLLPPITGNTSAFTSIAKCLHPSAAPAGSPGVRGGPGGPTLVGVRAATCSASSLPRWEMRLVSLPFALSALQSSFPASSGNGLKYSSLFDAQMDVIFTAMSAVQYSNVLVTVSKTRWPPSETLTSFFAQPYPEVAWIDGEIQESNKDEITVVYESGSRVVSKSANIYPKDPEFPHNGVEDMTKLAYLHEPGVLQNLHTYTGNILIAVNPFQRLPHLTETSTLAKYKGAAFGEQSPHPFAIASSAYSKMINEEKSQSILVSGENGAGKTESTKMLMHYLAFWEGEQQLKDGLWSNKFWSRFGKFVEIQFDQKRRISGAAIRTYLLERSRVCRVSDPERNYHCFYMLCAGPEEDVGKYKLGNPRKFHYLNQSNCIELDGVDDSKEYIATKRAMEVVGISSDEQEAIFRIVAAVLHLGNIEFVKGGEEEPDSSQPKDENSHYHLKTAAELLMCNEKSLEDSFCKCVMVTRGDTITKSLDPTAAALSRDALTKIIYSRLFDWIVDKINNSIGQDPDSKNLIGHVFKMEQEEYSKEEIDWSYIEFVDNQDVLDLIEKIVLLILCSMFPRSTHETFAEKLYQTFKDNKGFSKPKLSRTDFTIKHYAGGDVRLFPPLPEETTKATKFSSIATQFKQQLQSLLETLNAIEPHYIRCVKPNNLLKPGIFENNNVLQQLRCGGVMEAIRISCAGYPTRKSFDEFVQRFTILEPKVLKACSQEKIQEFYSITKLNENGVDNPNMYPTIGGKHPSHPKSRVEIISNGVDDVGEETVKTTSLGAAHQLLGSKGAVEMMKRRLTLLKDKGLSRVSMA
ncbi:hypothetical protein Fmac_008028 [Flemingia macrophylla]|uniref:Myosin motor domain-containing protein n=1 Tax=Flemingia macrophylla TaxID=520843 RepID=A0ABD1MW88_9FABA